MISARPQRALSPQVRTSRAHTASPGGPARVVQLPDAVAVDAYKGAFNFDRPDHVDAHGFFRNSQVEPSGTPERRLPPRGG